MPILPPTLTPRTKSRSYPTSHFNSSSQTSLRDSAKNHRTLLQPTNVLLYPNFKRIRFNHASLHSNQSTPKKSNQHHVQLPQPIHPTLAKAAAPPALPGFPLPTRAVPPIRTTTSSLTTSHSNTQHSPRPLGIAVVREGRCHTNLWMIHFVREYLSYSTYVAG